MLTIAVIIFALVAILWSLREIVFLERRKRDIQKIIEWLDEHYPEERYGR